MRNRHSTRRRLSRDVGSPRDGAVSCDSSWPPRAPPTPSMEPHLQMGTIEVSLARLAAHPVVDRLWQDSGVQDLLGVGPGH
jgi:hypothetical protein